MPPNDLSPALRKQTNWHRFAYPGLQISANYYAYKPGVAKSIIVNDLNHLNYLTLARIAKSHFYVS